MSVQTKHTLVAQPDGPSDVPTPDKTNGTHDEKSDSEQVQTNNSSGPELEQKERTIRGFPWFVICISLYITCFLYGLDTTIAADIQGPVIQAFGQVEQLAWIGAGFPLGSVCVILLLGTLFNTFNMKWVYIVTVVLFEVGSALCGGAPNMTALIVGRVIAGAGGSGIYLGSLQYYSVVTTEKERGFYMSLIGVFWGLGAILGPVIGGAFSVSAATWRWAFYINLVIGAISAPAFFLYLPSIRPMAGGQWPWNDGRTIGTFVAFGVVLVLFVLQQYFAIFTTPARRAFPVHLLRDRTQVLLYVVTAAGTTTLYVVVYYIPLFFQFVNDDEALMAAVRLLPFVASDQGIHDPLCHRQRFPPCGWWTSDGLSGSQFDDRFDIRPVNPRGYRHGSVHGDWLHSRNADVEA
jgi:MFS family permease